MAIEYIVGNATKCSRLKAEPRAKSFSNLFISLFMGEGAQDIGALEDTLEGTTKSTIEAQSLQKRLRPWTKIILKVE